MNNQPLISLIVPVYNVASYIDRCLESLCNQTYSNLEIIVVNDGSTDNSLDLCNQWANKDSRIKVISQENRGLSGARNTGLKHFTGEYVSYIDSDDWVHPQMIEILYKVLIKYGAEMSLCASVRVSDGYTNDIVYSDYKDSVCKGSELMDIFLNATLTACWSRLFRKDIIEGYEFPQGLNCEDYVYMYQAIRRTNRIAEANLPLYYYYYRENSIANEKFNIKKFDEFYSARKLYELACQYTPEYSRKSVVRLADGMVSLLLKSRRLTGFEDKEKEMISFSRHHIGVLLFNSHVYYKIRILLAVLILPRKLSNAILRLIHYL